MGGCAVPNTSSFQTVSLARQPERSTRSGHAPGGTFAVAFGINNLGQVVGQSDLIADPDRR